MNSPPVIRSRCKKWGSSRFLASISGTQSRPCADVSSKPNATSNTLNKNQTNDHTTVIPLKPKRWMRTGISEPRKWMTWSSNFIKHKKLKISTHFESLGHCSRHLLVSLEQSGLWFNSNVNSHYFKKLCTYILSISRKWISALTLTISRLVTCSIPNFDFHDAPVLTSSPQHPLHIFLR